MIRGRLHRYLLGLYDDPLFSILSQQWALDHWKWIGRYNDWHVARFGEKKGAGPWRHRVIGRAVCWVADWQTTLSLWFGRDEVLRLAKERGL